MPLLRVRKGAAGAVFPVFSSSVPTTVGRQGHAEVGLDDPKASRRHASLHLEHGAWIVQDLQSSNGTLVQGVRVTRGTITDGAVIQIGGTTLSFHAHELLPPLEEEIRGVKPLEASREESGVFVWRGRQAALDREVRCDWLHTARPASPRLCSRLRLADDDARELEDDSLVRPMHVHAEGGAAFTVARLLPDTLASRWDEILRLPLEQRLEIFRAILDAALERASWGSLRVPLSAAQVLLEAPLSARETWRVRLAAIELGAMAAEDAGDLQHLPAYVPYLPPEATGGFAAPAGAPALAGTLYSAGALGYHLLAGSPPMGTGNLAEVLDNHRNVRPAPAALVAPAVPGPISALLDRLLAKDPAHRPQGRAEALEPFARMPQRAAPPASPAVVARPIAARTPPAAPPQPAGAPAPRREPAAPSKAPPSPPARWKALAQVPVWLALSAACFFVARFVSRLIFDSMVG